MWVIICIDGRSAQRAGGGDQRVLAPFVLGGILRLAHAVGVEQQQIAGDELHLGLFVLRGAE